MSDLAFGVRCVFCLLLTLAGLIVFATAMSGDLADLLIQVIGDPHKSYQQIKENAEATANVLMLLGLFAAAGGPLGLLLTVRQRL